ncbi:MAG: hypothetical protein ACE144_10050 [Thermodesulfobacteriota bacterium]
MRKEVLPFENGSTISPISVFSTTIWTSRDDIKRYVRGHGLASHPSLSTELLEPKHRSIYSFRIDKRYRVLFIYLPGDKVEVIAITKHYRK